MEDVTDSFVVQGRIIDLLGWIFPSRCQYRLAKKKMATRWTERSREGQEVRRCA